MVPDGYEVFYVPLADAADFARNQFAENVYGADDAEDYSGWYWWSCQPGCLPDGDPSGPFATEEEAIADLTEEMFEEEDVT